tara:strand:+ start:551 stop:1189 length:639 start_codon:yes stop_codon:yes gene_type:complete
MLDFHTEHAIKNVLNAYGQNEAAFKGLFEPFNIDAGLLDRWWQQFLDAAGPDGTAEVRLAFWARQPKSLPTVSIQLLDETTEQAYFGDFIGSKDGVAIHGAEVNQSVQITVAAQTPGMLRAMTQVIRAGLFLMAKDLLLGGYDKFNYEGLDQLSLEEQLVAESLNVRVRRFVVEAQCQIVVPDLIDSSGGRITDVYVAASNINPPGGVTPDV